MLFSAPLPSSSSNENLVRWTPNGDYVAVATAARLVIIEAASMQIIANHVCKDNISTVAWSPGTHVL